MTKKLYYRLRTSIAGKKSSRKYFRADYNDVEEALRQARSMRELEEYTLSREDSDGEEEDWRDVEGLPDRPVTIVLTKQSGKPEIALSALRIDIAAFAIFSRCWKRAQGDRCRVRELHPVICKEEHSLALVVSRLKILCLFTLCQPDPVKTAQGILDSIHS